MINRQTKQIVELPFKTKQTLISEGHPKDEKGRVIADQGFFYKVVAQLKRIERRRRHTKMARKSRQDQQRKARNDR